MGYYMFAALHHICGDSGCNMLYLMYSVEKKGMKTLTCAVTYCAGMTCLGDAFHFR